MSVHPGTTPEQPALHWMPDAATLANWRDVLGNAHSLLIARLPMQELVSPATRRVRLAMIQAMDEIDDALAALSSAEQVERASSRDEQDPTEVVRAMLTESLASIQAGKDGE